MNMNNKNKGFKKYICGASIIAISSFSFGANALSLKEALVFAYKNNPELKAAREASKAADEALPRAYSGWLPTLTANYTRSRFRDDDGTNSATSTPHSTGLNYSQNLFSGGSSYFSVRQAQNSILASRARLHQTEQRVLTSAILAYIDVVRLREITELSKKNEAALKEQLNATKERFKLGETTRTDVAQAKSRLASAVSDRISAEGSLIEADADFKEIFEINSDPDMAYPVIFPEIPESYDILKEKSIKLNPGLKALEYDNLVAQDNIKISKSSLLPSVNLNGAYQDDNNLRTRSGGGDLETSSVTLNVTMPLFQSGAEYSRIRENKRLAERAKYNLKQQYNITVKNSMVAWKDVETTKASLKANQTAVEAAKLALEGVKQEREIGSRTTLNVLDQEQELFSAEISLVTSERNMIISVFNVQSSLGKLTAQDLGLDTEIYNPKVYYDKVKYKMFGF